MNERTSRLDADPNPNPNSLWNVYNSSGSVTSNQEESTETDVITSNKESNNSMKIKQPISKKHWWRLLNVITLLMALIALATFFSLLAMVSIATTLAASLIAPIATGIFFVLIITTFISLEIIKYKLNITIDEENKLAQTKEIYIEVLKENTYLGLKTQIENNTGRKINKFVEITGPNKMKDRGSFVNCNKKLLTGEKFVVTFYRPTSKNVPDLTSDANRQRFIHK